MNRPTVVLIGPSGAGKTVTGRALAAVLGVAFHDTDEAVERRSGRSVSDLFVEDGEAAFRQLERAEVARALVQETGVVALGGGAVLDPGTRSELARHRVVFLDVGIADAGRRIGLDRSRPLLALNPRASWIAMMRDRRPVYESVSALRVDTAGRSPEDVAGQIAAALPDLRPRCGHTGLTLTRTQDHGGLGAQAREDWSGKEQS